MKQGTNWAPRFAVFGDMGNKNARILGRLQEETMQGHFDAILHVGDFAYDLDTVSCTRSFRGGIFFSLRVKFGKSLLYDQ